MGNRHDCTEGETDGGGGNHVRVEVTWYWNNVTTRADPTKKPISFEIAMTEKQIDGGALWPLARGALVERGLLADDPSVDVSWALSDFLTKYEDGRPVYDTVFVGPKPVTGKGPWKPDRQRLRDPLFVRLQAFQWQ